MRKIPIFLLVLLLLCTGVLTTAQLTLSDKGMQVTYTPQTISGDPSLAEDLHVNYLLTMDGRILWQPLYHVADNRVDISISHRFSNPFSFPGVGYDNRFSLYSDLDRWSSNTWEEENPLQEVWDELKETSVSTGQQAEQLIRLGDYYEYYPLAGYVVNGQTHTEWSSLYPDLNPLILQAIADYFPIPVLENQYLWLHADVRENGPSYYGLSPSYDKPEHDWFTLHTSYCMTKDAVYFVFSNRTSRGNLVDTSRIPGGYGIYCLPISGQVSQFGYLSTIHTIDPAHEALSIHASEDGRFLYLITLADKEAEALLTVVDTTRPEAVQTISLPDTEGQRGGPSQVYVGEDHLLMVWSSTRLYLITRGEDGSHRLEFVTQPVERSYSQGELTFDGVSVHYTRSPSPAYLWDGEKLIFALPAPSPGVEMHNSQMVSFDLVIFDREGLQFFGHYESSLNSQSWDHPVYGWGPHSLYLYQY